MNPENTHPGRIEKRAAHNWENPPQVASFDGMFECFSPDASKVCLGFPFGKRVVRSLLDTNDEGISYENNRLTSTAFNSDGDFILGKCQRNVIEVSNESKDTFEQFTVSDSVTTSIPLSSDARFLATVCRGGNAYIFDVENPEDVVRFDQKDWKWGYIFFSESGNMLATNNQDGVLKIFSRKSKEEIATITSEKSKIKTVRFASDDSMFAIGAENGTVSIINIGSTENSSPDIEIPGGVVDVQFFDKDKNLATISKDGAIRIYDAHSGLSVAELPKIDNAIGFTISPDDSKIAVSISGFKTIVLDIIAGLNP
jgi:WD40 repeat protein